MQGGRQCRRGPSASRCTPATAPPGPQRRSPDLTSAQGPRRGRGGGGGRGGRRGRGRGKGCGRWRCAWRYAP
eukprot:858174-Rhodomonas_salina.2